ncbi:MAG: nitrite reductase [Desulfobulbaceae bacterium]|nr:nitrite reductase [Desulfobulbaceae bacterium]
MQNIKHVTILLPGGLLAPEKLEAINTIARKYKLTCYLTTAQNFRLLGANEDNFDEIKAALTDVGCTLKTSGKFPKPKVCVGMPYCNLGLADTFALSDKILAKYGDRTEVKPKYKIAISGCPAGCGGALVADIGIVAVRNGFEVYAGGKGGALPKVGKRIGRALNEEEVLELVGELADYHAAHTEKKQRMFKLITEPDFPSR